MFPLQQPTRNPDEFSSWEEPRQWEQASGALLTILRWEDDGGQTLDLYPLWEGLEKQGP